MSTIKNITDIDDYVGLIHLTDEPQGNDYFNKFCFDIEKQILTGIDYNDYGLIGTEVYNDLISDLDSKNEPQNAPYINLVDGVAWTDSGGIEHNFIGLRKLLTYFVYAEYLKRSHFMQSGIGTVNLQPKNAQKAEIKYMHREANMRWNIGVDYYNGQAYDYLLEYQSDFNNWNFTQQGKYLTNGII